MRCRILCTLFLTSLLSSCATLIVGTIRGTVCAAGGDCSELPVALINAVNSDIADSYDSPRPVQGTLARAAATAPCPRKGTPTRTSKGYRTLASLLNGIV